MEHLGLGKVKLVPSSTECTRLQRGFLRFEIYSRLFPAHKSNPWDTPPPELPFSASDQFDLFLALLTPWEVEEMACIEHYYSSLIGEYMDQLEEQFISAVMTSPGVVLPQPSEEPTTANKHGAEQENKREQLVDVKDLDLTALVLFSHDGRYRSPQNISYMTSLGLDFIYNLITSEENKRFEMIRSNSPLTRDFLQRALSHAPRWPPGHQHDEATAPDHRAVTDDPSQSNLGYRLFRTTPDNDMVYVPIVTWGSRYSLLRQLGYVFWDAGRVQSPKVFEMLAAADNMSQDEIRKQFDRRCRKPAEERLKGVKLPWGEMDRIERQYGTTMRNEE
ncbi:hypothetical protein F66182_4960 [Fusarium sp. NRRL 66182]|nr:hypothetical protein F66182_4960 [Fusarium sp. NRRL 66182]